MGKVNILIYLLMIVLFCCSSEKNSFLVENSSDRTIEITLIFKKNSPYKGNTGSINNKTSSKKLEKLKINKLTFQMGPYAKRHFGNCYPIHFQCKDISSDRSSVHIVNSYVQSVSLSYNLTSLKIVKEKPKYPNIKSYDIKFIYGGD